MYESEEEIMSLSDELKLDYIKNMSDRYQKIDIAKSIKSDDLKIQALSFLDTRDVCGKRDIIITLQSDEKKIEAMKQYLINSSSLCVKIINTFSSTENKIQAMRLLKYESDKRNVILALDEKSRIDFLGEIRSPKMQEEIIDSIKDDNIKIEHLQNISNENLKCRVLMSLGSDEQKLIQLQQLNIENEENLAMVITSLKDDEVKLEQLKKIVDSKNIALIKMSLTNREDLKATFLDKNRVYSKIGLDEKITIGIEIESEGEMSSRILKLMEIAKKQNGKGEKGWQIKTDASLAEGVEVTSPILTDNKEDVEEIYMVCSMLQKCEQEISERCGGHIHIGADYLKSEEAYVNLFEIWGNVEKIICKISNEVGTIPRAGLKDYAFPISPKLNEAIENGSINLEGEEDLEEFVNELRKVQNKKRHAGLNLLSNNNTRNTVEFRISNGTLNPDIWIENARLYGRIIQISQKLADIEKQPKRSKEDERLIELKNHLKEEIPEQEKMEMLLELLFLEEERKTYRERYISSSELLEQIPDVENPLKGMNFSHVDFDKKKHSLKEFHDVAINDRIETINEVTRETMRGIRTEGELEQTKDENTEEKI